MSSATIAQQVNTTASRTLVPISAFAEITHRCNLSCYYCYQHPREITPERSTGEWAAMLGKLAEAGSLYVTFSGGEPLLREDLFVIIEAARKHAFAVSVISNGTRITRDAAGRFADLGVMDVGVSLLAFESTLHDELCGVEGAYAKAVKAIEHLQSAGVNVLIKHTVSARNFGEYEKLDAFAREQGCVFECDITVLPGRTEKTSRYSLSTQQTREFLSDMQVDSPASCVTDSATWSLHCDAGRSLCGIAPGGEVYPCILLPIRFGNLCDQSFDDIWQGRAAKRFRTQEETLAEECEQCAIRTACSRCHAVAWRESGDWRGAAASLCSQAKAHARIH